MHTNEDRKHDGPRETTTSMLERLSLALLNTLNARDYDFASQEAQELVSHISGDWKAQMDTYAASQYLVTWPQQVAKWKQRAEEHPDVHFKLADLSSSVDERKGVADVFMSMEVTGIAEVTLHAMNELKWRRVFGEWQLYYVVGMRGSPGNAGG